ncbi:MAG: hypothetical protein IK076_08555 [Bacteroidales bacterium]|nr:hypothetical protein [Bacteroidales bacterium]
MKLKSFPVILAALLLPAGLPAQDAIPDDFISFSVPGHEEEMELIRGIYYEAYMNPAARPGPSFWDPWTPEPLMCVAPIKADMEALWKQAFLNRRITDEGYVSSHQHYSHALDDGWPFPLFPQVNTGFEGNTFGYIFQDGPDKINAMLSYFKDELDKKGYIGERAVSRMTVNDFLSEGIVDDAWQLTATGDCPSIETEEGFRIDAFLCPFVNFRTRLDTDEPLQGILEWQCEGDKEYSKSRSIVFNLQQDDPFGRSKLHYCTIEPSSLETWKGAITKLHVSFPGAKGVRFRIDSFFSAFNTRHQMNACNFLMGSIHTFNHTGDLDYLRQNIGRMRKVFAYAQKELYDRKAGMIRVRYQGHDGLPGFVTDEDGNRKYQFGHSIGGNYWDILPFGNLETYTSYYYVYSLRAMADLEEYIRKEKPSGIPSGGSKVRPGKLRREANRIVRTLNKRMWNEDKERFYGTEDIEGRKWDYGFVFLNQEAIYYGAATPGHAREIMDWIDGRRIIEGETSTGEDIYRWRLAPRATTMRNEEWYYWAWDPNVFPFGRQVQDGGAVFAQSFNDMMGRISVYGPDNAWERFKGILDWYRETREAGGYRAYYADGSHGNSMQGSGTAGGIGIDLEFAETILVPYTMIEGFLGFKATPEGYTINPNLPSDWKSLTVDNLYFRGQRLSVTVDENGVNVKIIQ